MTRTERYSLTVDYERPLAELIAAGGYDHANAYVTETSFPTSGRGIAVADALLVCLEHGASTEEVLRELDRSGVRPGRIAELLALGAAQPDLQRSFPIVALGSVAAYPDDYRRIPFLWGSPRVRHLDLRWDEHSWAANIRFLAIRALGEDQPRAAATSHEADRPAGEDEQPVLQPDQVQKVDEEPCRPGGHTAELQTHDVGDRPLAPDCREVAFVIKSQK